RGAKLLDRLVHDYPTHGFAIDQEEAQDLGIPTRIPDAQEAAILDQLALALIEYGTKSDIITIVGQPAAAIGAVQQVLDSRRVVKQGTASPRKSRQRSKKPQMGSAT
ncbi:MAG TPA: hypothetical protein VF579_02330, partial [Candidatus Methylomirabilis sp.]